MEAFQSQRLLIQYSYGDEVGCNRSSDSSLVAGCGNVTASRVSLSTSAIPCHSNAKCSMNWTRAHSLCTTTAGHRLYPNTSSRSATRQEVKFPAGCAGNWSSSRSRSSSSAQHFKELLLVASHPSGRNGRAYSVTITTSPFELWPRRTTIPADNVLYKVLKISGSSMLYWLKRKRKELLSSYYKHLLCGNHWRTPVVQRSLRYTSFSSAAFRPEVSVRSFPRRHGVGLNGSTSDYYNRYNSVSSQAEGMFENSSLENAILVDQQQQKGLHPNGDRGNYLATGYGWRVRDAAGELQELIRVADIQTGAFHEKSAVFDDIFYKIFHAEVLSSLQYKARHSDPGRYIFWAPVDKNAVNYRGGLMEREPEHNPRLFPTLTSLCDVEAQENMYACLLAERDSTRLDSLEALQSTGTEPIIVGAVDITAFADKSIVCHLVGAEEYLYVSGMAVEADYRRRGVATLLLEACLTRAIEWGFEYLVLHAYEDDFRARNVYSRAGYSTISADPAWMTKFFGRRRRVVMARRTHDIKNST